MIGKQSYQLNGAIAKANDRNRSSEEANLKSIGIVQLSFAYLFEQIKRRKLRDKTLYVITVSYLEVYNEQVQSYNGCIFGKIPPFHIYTFSRYSIC